MKPFSIVIPVYNEELILETSIARLINELAHRNLKNYEIVISENGSTDNTNVIIKRLKRTYDNIRDIHLPKADFGESICQGIYTVSHERVVVVNADWWDVNFINESLQLVEKYPLVIGSKHLVKTLDRRPLRRKFASRFLTYLLQKIWGFRGTDTHGLKTFQSRRAIIPILKRCVTKEIIESELAIRVQRQGLSIIEIPVSIEEIRPARKSLVRRGLRVIKELVTLYKDLRIPHAAPRR